MSPGTWNDTTAGLLINGGLAAEPPFAARAAEFDSAERRAERVAFAAAVAADPAWQASRETQRELAERGWPGTMIHVGSSVPPELAPLYAARSAAQTPMATWGPAGRGGMAPTNDLAAQIEQHQRDRMEAAQLRQQMNRRPVENPAPYDLGQSVAGASGDDDGW